MTQDHDLSPASSPSAGLAPEELAFLQSTFEMARQGDVALLDLVDRGLPVNLTNSSGDTLLVLSTYHRHHELVDGLLARGADVERVNDRGQTALGCAVFRHDEHLVTSLLAAGANPDGGGRTPRELAAFFDLPEMARLLPPATPLTD